MIHLLLLYIIKAQSAIGSNPMGSSYMNINRDLSCLMEITINTTRPNLYPRLDVCLGALLTTADYQ